MLSLVLVVTPFGQGANARFVQNGQVSLVGAQ